MENFIFNENDISQHIVKYGVDIRPPIVPKQEKEKLQSYCNWLIEHFPEAFETLLSGPEKTIVQKTFLAGDKRIELPTFAMTRRGPLYTFPVRFLVQNAEDFNIPARNKIFRSAIDKLIETFVGKIVRVGVVHEIIFDCGNINPVEIIASAMSKERWREGLRNIRIHLENPENGYNINIDLAPAYAQQVIQSPAGTKRKNIGFGISVKLDINNQKMTEELDKDMVAAILAFAEDYMPDKLVKFLNNERS
jgi:hypothetical protein